jgi:hypothetical protein
VPGDAVRTRRFHSPRHASSRNCTDRPVRRTE